ncbi:MAG: hypothetical protein IKG93_11205 [Clostridiales bacterium]|nr:hypothetical protein [Clostridiales bacterium]
MKRSKLIKCMSIMLSLMMLFSCCTSCNKASETKRTTTTEETEEEETTTTTTAQPITLEVNSLDQFISDGSIFAEDVPISTPTPIPVKQTPIAGQNDGKGYYSGKLENAVIIDNQYFRYTIFDMQMDGEHYYVNGEFENKSDKQYALHFKNPTIDNESNNYYLESDDVLAPHSTMADTTDFARCTKDYHGQEFTRISFLLLAVSQSGKETMPIAEDGSNYILVNIFPQGEDAFVYQDTPLQDTAEIVVDTEGALFTIDSFELTDYRMNVHYTIRNKTTDYLQLKLKDETIMIDDTVFDKVGHQSTYIAPFSSISGVFYVPVDRFSGTKVDPKTAKTIALPVIVNSLTDGIKVLWERLVKTEINYG